MKRILTYRFSAMGDVVMLLPVLKGLLSANKNMEVYLLTRPFLFPVFHGIDRLHLVAADLNGEHKGMKGLFRLYKQLKTGINPDLVFDLHQVLRTFTLNLFFRVGGFKIYSFRKGQLEKQRAVISKSHKKLSSTIERYVEVFHRAGLQFELPEPPFFEHIPKKEIIDKLQLETSGTGPIIGIAPFAKHLQKIWGEDKIRSLMQNLNSIPNISFVLFGGGKKEMGILDKLAAEFPNAVVAGNILKFSDELKILPQLDVMISMDSANMHLAAMAGIPVISIWGATHPSLGFAPYYQPEENQIQYEGTDLTCRPCSVFGNKKCKFGDVRCMKYIPVESVEDRVRSLIKNQETYI